MSYNFRPTTYRYEYDWHKNVRKFYITYTCIDSDDTVDIFFKDVPITFDNEDEFSSTIQFLLRLDIFSAS